MEISPWFDWLSMLDPVFHTDVICAISKIGMHALIHILTHTKDARPLIHSSFCCDQKRKSGKSFAMPVYI